MTTAQHAEWIEGEFTPLDELIARIEKAVGPKAVTRYTKKVDRVPTKLELASALRGAAEFCRDPKSPKSPGVMAYRDNPDGTADPRAPWGDDADHWCAMGRACYHLRERNEAVLFAAFDRYKLSPEPIYETFDDLDYLHAATVLDQMAAWLELQIETGQPEYRFVPDFEAAPA